MCPRRAGRGFFSPEKWASPIPMVPMSFCCHFLKDVLRFFIAKKRAKMRNIFQDIPSIFELIKIETYYTYHTYRDFWDPSMRCLVGII